MVEGKFQDDATWKQAKVIVDLGKTGGGQRPGTGPRLRSLARVYGLYNDRLHLLRAATNMSHPALERDLVGRAN